MNTSYYGTPPTSDEIMHFGVKGMRWGVRRYENKDGTLTPLGKRRVNAYNENLRRQKRIYTEANKLFDRDKSLHKKFKDVEKAIHDERFNQDEGGPFLSIEARKRGIDTSKYEKAIRDADTYRFGNYGDINEASKYLSIKRMTDKEYKNWKNDKIKRGLKTTAKASAVAAALYGHHKFKKWMKNVYK